MNHLTRRTAALGLVLALVGSGSTLWAQDPAPPSPPTPPVEPEGTPAATPSEEPPQPRAKRFGLYVGVGFGSASGDDIETSIETTPTTTARGFLSLDDMDFGRAAIGWRLAEEKGDLRLVFNGYKETSYSMSTVGFQNKVVTLNSDQTVADCVAPSGPCLLPWWVLEIADGDLRSERFPPTWDRVVDDANGNNTPDIDEITILQASNLVVTASLPDSLENQVQTVDLIYGREFGGRRYSSHWWAGLRGFEYKGNTLGAAWLLVNLQGAGFTDGALLRVLNVSQDTSGFGPLGAWEADFNFFDKRLALFVKGQAAIIFQSTTMDTGDFYTLARVSGTEPAVFLSAPARLREERDKSTWQNSVELGARYVMRNGLQFELAYNLTGFLDAVLTPTGLTIPANDSQVNQGTSGLFHTHDLRVDGVYGSVAFQF